MPSAALNLPPQSASERGVQSESEKNPCLYVTADVTSGQVVSPILLISKHTGPCNGEAESCLRPNEVSEEETGSGALLPTS